MDRQLAVRKPRADDPVAAPVRYTADGGALSHDFGLANRLIMEAAKKARSELEVASLPDDLLATVLYDVCRAAVMLGTEGRGSADTLYAATLLLQRARPEAVEAFCRRIGTDMPQQHGKALTKPPAHSMRRCGARWSQGIRCELAEGHTADHRGYYGG